MQGNVTEFTHPLIMHKISLIRDKNCGTREFRTVIGEIATLMGYEILRDLETELVEIETPMEKAYYCKLPEDIDQRLVLIVDPMLATGGSADAAIEFVKKQGAKQIKFASIIAAPEGIKMLTEKHPDIQIYGGSIEIIKLQLFIDCDRIRKLILACFINAMETDTERY